jgi:hypothetical protein
MRLRLPSRYAALSVLAISSIYPTNIVRALAADTVNASSAFIVNLDGGVSSRTNKNLSSLSSMNGKTEKTMPLIDSMYPGTAVERLNNVHARVRQLVEENALMDVEWNTIRSKLLWAGGLRDLPNARPGQVSVMNIYIPSIATS